MSDVGYSIRLMNSPLDAVTDGDTDVGDELTGKFPVWRHGTRAVGGNWQAEGEYEGTPDEMRDFFLSNLGLRLAVSAGGIDYWKGPIVRMEYTTKGQTFVRTLEDRANRVKIIYTKVGAQLLTNGDVESGAWTAVGTPSTHETTTDWFAKGTTAMHVVTDAADEGTQAEAGVAISASRAYVCSMIVNVVSGTWTLKVLDGSSNVIAQRATDGAAGREWLQCQIPDTNAETSVTVQLTADDASREVYADGAILRSAPTRSETKWYEDMDSISAYGRIEGIFLEGEMTDTEADNQAQRKLAEHAWPRTRGPERAGTLKPGKAQEDKLTVTAMGMVWTLGWRHALTDGTDQATNHVTALLDESEFITSASALLDANTAEVLIESSNPVTLWRCLEKVIEVGDGAGATWMGGVYPGKEFRFNARPTAMQYDYSNGRLTAHGGGNVVLLEVAPDWVLNLDMPLEPTEAGAADEDDPRRQFMKEVWFIAEKGATRLEWSWDKP
jgi:hypothetical protein